LAKPADDTIALIGGETLLGREVREVFGESSLGSQLRLIASGEEESGTLTEIGGAAAFLAKLAPDAVEDAAIIVLAGTFESSKEALAIDHSGVVVDLTGFIEDEPESQLRSPLAEPPDYRPDFTGPQVVAHPAATGVAMILATLHRALPISRAIVHIFEPASERGKAGIDELQQQAVTLFSFQPMPKTVFDRQVAFNLGPGQIAHVEERIERHLATLLERGESGAPMPSIRLVQGPVFHGYTMSFHIEFEDAADITEIEEALTAEWVDFRGPDVEPPDNVGVAGQSGIAIGGISPDRNEARAVWVWAALDNLRLAADSAVLIARQVL
jgi:aspartate-semialdehyde dehydrogenase